MMKHFISKLSHFLEHHHTTIVGVIAGVTILAGIIYSIGLGETLRFLPDEQDYLTLADNLVTQGIYSLDGANPTAYRAPGYPLFLAGLNFLGASVLLLRSANFFLLGLSIWVVHLILVDQGKPLAGILAACWLSVGYPVLFYSAGTFYPQTLAGFLNLLGIMLVAKKSEKWIYILFGGAVFGLLGLTVPTMFTIGLIVASWLWKQQGLKRGIVFLGFMILTILPWIVRNYNSLGAFVLFTTGSGENLLLGNSENAAPTSSAGTDISQYRVEAENQGFDEVETDKYYRDRAVNFILENPAGAFNLYIQKFLNYFNYRNQLVTTSESSAMKDLLMLFTYTPLLVGLLASLLWQKWGKLTSLEILAQVLYFSGGLVYAIFFTRVRFRLPYDGVLILVVSSFLAKGLNSYLRHSAD